MYVPICCLVNAVACMSSHRIDHSGVEYVRMELRNARVKLVNVQPTDIVLYSRDFSCKCGRTFHRKGDLTRHSRFCAYNKH